MNIIQGDATANIGANLQELPKATHFPTAALRFEVRESGSVLQQWFKPINWNVHGGEWRDVSAVPAGTVQEDPVI